MNHAPTHSTIPDPTASHAVSSQSRSFWPPDADELPYLPHKVVLTDKDDEARLLDELQHLYTAHFDAWAVREHERILSRETRFEDDDPAPEFPLIVKTSRRRTSPLFIILPNGQRVLRLDATRIQTLCGIQHILPLTEALSTFRQRTGRTRCSHCEGFHCSIAPRQVIAITPPGLAFSVHCPKCGTDASASYIWEDRDTRKCLLCSHRLYRPTALAGDPSQPLGTLSEEEIQANEERIACALLRNGVYEQQEEDGLESDEMDDSAFDLGDMEAAPDESEDDHTALDPFSSHEVDEETIQDDSEPPDQDDADLKDRLHEPAYALFTKGRTPLRQAMLDQAIRALDRPDHRMAMWTAAGRILRESAECIAAADAVAIAEWLRSLPDEDLTLMAGDLNSPNPELILPALSQFWNTDRLLIPLFRFFGEQLRRFRNKEAGCRILAADYGLSEAALAQIAVAYGYLPAPSHTNTTACITPHAA